MTAGVTARTHWPGLDGLRGVAAIVVVLFHAGLGLSANGYVGVDVFFALSGFLITAILLSEIAKHGRVRLRRFYFRRLLRLYPALVATCLLVLAAGAAGGELSSAWRGIMAALLYVANWWMYTGHEAPLLDHTWTLAIEEHFYFVWPLLLLTLTNRRRWVSAIGALVAFAVMLIIFVPWSASIENVRGTYLRGFPIVWGSILAVLVHSWRHRFPERPVVVASTLATGALLAVLFMPLTIPEGVLTGPLGASGLLTVVVLAGVVVSPGSVASRSLSWAPLRWFGARSYGLYLYHFPVMSVLRHHVDVGPDWARVVLGMVLSVVVAWASFRWLEEPFLRLKDRIGRSEAAILATGKTAAG